MVNPTEAAECRDERIERLLRCFQMAHNHELPNHLVAIQGLVRLLKLEMATQIDQGCQEIFSRLEAAAQRTNEVIRALAAAGRVGSDACARAPTSIEEAAREAGAAVNQLFPRAVLEYDFPADPLIAILETSALNQVLYYLIRRAAQSVPMPGSVHVQIGARNQDGRLEIWVADDGPGLSARECEHVFDPFAGDHRQEAARGLGLFLVSQWVQYWGGEVRISSQAGNGNVFTVSCPGALLHGPSQQNNGSKAAEKTIRTADSAK